MAGFIAFEVAPYYTSFEPAPVLRCGTPDGPAYVYSEAAEKAMPIFKANCARCHSPHLQIQSTGPALYGVLNRVPNREWIAKFLRAPRAMYETDAYAIAIHEKHPHSQHPKFDYLTNEEVELLVKMLSE